MQHTKHQSSNLEAYKSLTSSFSAAIVLSIFFALAMELPWLDPTAFSGAWFGNMLAIVWVGGLLILSLRVVRTNQSRFSLRTLLIITTVLGVALTLGTVLGRHVPVLIFMFAVSIGMIREYCKFRRESRHATFSKPTHLAMGIVVLAGMLGLAHASRVTIYLALYRVGLLGSF